MAKDKDFKRETKGKPSKSIKEKQAAKRAKLAAKMNQGVG
jgi:hypothetical protein